MLLMILSSEARVLAERAIEEHDSVVNAATGNLTDFELRDETLRKTARVARAANLALRNVAPAVKAFNLAAHLRAESKRASKLPTMAERFEVFQELAELGYQIDELYDRAFKEQWQ